MRGDEVRREDGELLGYVRRDEDRWLGLTVFGGLLGGRSTAGDAARLVRDEGLASLARRWFHRPPGGEWQVVIIQEAWPGRAVGIVGLYALPGAPRFEIRESDLAAGHELTLEPPPGFEEFESR